MRRGQTLGSYRDSDDDDGADADRAHHQPIQNIGRKNMLPETRHMFWILVGDRSTSARISHEEGLDHEC